MNNEFPTHYLPISQKPIFDDALISNLNTHTVLGGVSAKQIIYAGHQIKYGREALQEKEKAQRLMAEAAKEEIAMEVIETFDQLMLLHEIDTLIIHTEQRLNIEKQRIEMGIKNGLAVPYDRDKIALALLELEEKKLDVAGSRSLLYEKLQYLTHMDAVALMDINYKLAPMDEFDFVASPEKRLELKALSAGQKAQEMLYNKEKGSLMPSVFAFANVNYFNAFGTHLNLKDVPSGVDIGIKADHLSLQPAMTIGVGFKWNLLDGGAQDKKIKKAALEVSMAETKLKDTEEKLTLLISKNKTDLNVANMRIDVASKQIVIAANSLDLATKQYQSGLIDLPERLAAENDYYRANFNYYTNLLNQRKASVSLLVATGELIEKTIGHE